MRTYTSGFSFLTVKSKPLKLSQTDLQCHQTAHSSSEHQSQLLHRRAEVMISKWEKRYEGIKQGLTFFPHISRKCFKISGLLYFFFFFFKFSFSITCRNNLDQCHIILYIQYMLHLLEVQSTLHAF